MGRIRSLKPEVTRSRRLADVPPEVRWTFAALLCHVDDEGRAEDDPRLIKADLYPYDDITAGHVDKHLGLMTDARLLCRYEVAGRRYLHVLDFVDAGLPANERAPWGQRPQKPYPSRWPDCGIDHSRYGGQLGLFPGQGPDEHGGDTGTQPVGENTRPRYQVPGTKYQVPGTKEYAQTAHTAPTGKLLAAAFDAFWGVYPRKEGKRRAQAEFALALARADLATILAGAQAYRDRPGRQAQYTKHPSTWLHQDCWEDDPNVTPGPPALVASRGDTRMAEHLAAKAERAQRRGQAHAG